MITNQDFANSVIRTLRDALATDDVELVGSMRADKADEYSDVDVCARVDRPLNDAFFASLIDCIKELFGRATVRYDPDYRSDLQAQDLRFTLYDFPVSWRIDLLVTSDQASCQKFPDPFPEWSIATSAFWNLVWAVKYDRRNRPDAADEYMTAACEKLHVDPVAYSVMGAQEMLASLENKDEVDVELLDKLRGVLTA